MLHEVGRKKSEWELLHGQRAVNVREQGDIQKVAILTVSLLNNCILLASYFSLSLLIFQTLTDNECMF